MALQVCFIHPTISIFSHCTLFSVGCCDYVNVSGQIVQFMRGDVIHTHTITINDDDACEVGLNEYFYSHIDLDSGIPPINVTVQQIRVTIDDNDEPECGKLCPFCNGSFCRNRVRIIICPQSQ